MIDVSIRATTIPDSWFQALKICYEQGDKFQVGFGSEPSWTKKISAHIVIEHPDFRPLLSDKAFNDEKYLSEYWCTKLWEPDVPTDEIYTYADRMCKPVNQRDELIKRMATQPLDRQLAIVIRLPVDVFKTMRMSNELWDCEIKENDKPVKHEPPCLSLLNFDIEQTSESWFKSHLRVYFRSWDLPAGYPINMAGLQLWHEEFIKQVNEISPFQFKTGMLIGDSVNLHIYDRQFKIVDAMIHNTLTPKMRKQELIKLGWIKVEEHK